MTDKEEAIKELKEVLDRLDITSEYRLNLIRAIEYLQEEPVSNDVLDTVDKKARKIWSEINTGHEYSIIDSYNQFYGICMEIAEMVKKEPVSIWHDKVQKIREKVVEMVNSINPFIPDEDGKNSDYEAGKLDAATHILQIIDSLEESVSEELEDAASSFAKKDSKGINNPANFYYTVADKARIFKAGAKWQIAKLMKDATEVTVHIEAGGYPYIPQIELYDYDNDVPLAKEGDKYKVVLIKDK